MDDTRKKLIYKVRNLSIALSLGIVLLSLQSLWAGEKIFLQYAGWLALLGLLIVSLMISRIVKKH